MWALSSRTVLMCEWQERALKLVGRMGWSIKLGKAISSELMSDFNDCSKTPLTGGNGRILLKPHIHECDGTINLKATAAAWWWREQSINLWCCLIPAYINSMNHGSPQLTATLSFAVQLRIYQMDAVGWQTRFRFFVSVLCVSIIFFLPSCKTSVAWLSGHPLTKFYLS